MWKKVDQPQKINMSKIIERIVKRFKAAFVTSLSLRDLGMDGAIEFVLILTWLHFPTQAHGGTNYDDRLGGQPAEEFPDG
jgi:hypothetical protein